MSSMVAARLSQGGYYLPSLLFRRLVFPFHLETGARPLRLTSDVSIPGNPPFIPPVTPLALSKHVSYCIVIISSHIPFQNNTLNISRSYYCSSKTSFKYYDIMHMYHNVNV